MVRMTLEEMANCLESKPDVFKVPSGKPKLTKAGRDRQKAHYADRADICRVLAKYLIILKVNFHLDYKTTTMWIDSVRVTEGILQFTHSEVVNSEEPVDHITMLLRMADAYDDCYESVNSVENMFYNLDVDYDMQDFIGHKKEL